MTIVILSDSHRRLGYMRRCVTAVRPDMVIHLGDLVDDAVRLHGEFPHIPMYQVPGNCDFGTSRNMPPVSIQTVDGVRLFLTHGHMHQVKEYSGRLLQDARTNGVDAVLYGHTHQAVCRQEEDGLWVVNPGSCGDLFTRTAAVMVIRDGKIQGCRLLQDEVKGFQNL